MRMKGFARELKKGSAELLILSLLEQRARHGYEISKLIEQRSEGVLQFNVASFYPLLYRLEERGFIEGRWVEKAGQRRRRYYRVTAEGRAVLKEHRSAWANAGAGPAGTIFSRVEPRRAAGRAATAEESSVCAGSNSVAHTGNRGEHSDF